MQKQTKFNLTATYTALLEQVFSFIIYFDNLFSRQNLCSNNYLYKQMNQNFEIPLAGIIEERRIAQITNSQKIIKQTLQMCTLVQLISNKTVRIHDFPSLKFPHKYKDLVNELVRNLKTQNRKVKVFDKKQQNQITLALLEIKPVKQLQEIALNFDKNWDFKVADLHSDLKIGIARIRKLKQQNKRSYKSEKYSLDKPPGIFIRRAVQSSDKQEDNPYKKQTTKFKKQQEKEKQKKYREKPVINLDQFPTLS